MTETKRDWRKPELTVLVRNNPEEVVLYGCKSSNAQGPPRASGYLHCKHGGLADDGQPLNHVYCSTEVAS